MKKKKLDLLWPRRHCKVREDKTIERRDNKHKRWREVAEAGVVRQGGKQGESMKFSVMAKEYNVDVVITNWDWF